MGTHKGSGRGKFRGWFVDKGLKERGKSAVGGVNPTPIQR